MHYLMHVSWVGYVLYRSYTSFLSGGLVSIDDISVDR